MTSATDDLRAPNGFSSIRNRPEFKVVLAPSTPINELKLATSGSRPMTSPSACCLSVIAANEISWLASEIPWIAPVSCNGKNPFGIST